MRFTDLFIRRPVLALVVSLLILLIGLKCMLGLQIRQYPQLYNTTITVTTVYPGASPDLIEGFITTPIEQAVATAEGIDYLTSTSVLGTSTVTAYIKLNYDPSQALTDIMAKVQQVKYLIPTAAQDPIILKATGQTTAVMYIGFASAELQSAAISDYLTRVVQPLLSTVDGVSSADILGGQTFAMRLWLDPAKMAARGISAADVSAAIRANNYQSAPGQAKGFFTVTNIDAKTGLANVEQFKRMVVKATGGAVVRVEDIAKVDLGAQSWTSSVMMNGQQAVFIGVQATPTGNPLSLVAGVRALLPEIQRNLPPSVKMQVAYDSTKFIQASIDEVQFSLGLAVAIVVAVIFLFLGSFRSVLIPIVTIPLSLIGAGIIMTTLGFSLNLLTLLAMVLAIGLVVDDAIVVLENIYRHIEEGKSAPQAALIGAREIAGPVIAMTLTLAAVYAPIGFLGGVTGTLFREFAFTLAGAVIISGIVAVTLSPMMCSVLLSPGAAQGRCAADRPRLLAPRRGLRPAPRALARLPASDRAVCARGLPRARLHVPQHQEGAGAGRGPGRAVRADQGAAIRQPRLQRLLRRRARQGVHLDPGSGSAVCRQRPLRADPGHCRGHPEALGRAGAHRPAAEAGPAAEGQRGRGPAGLRLLAAAAAGFDRRLAGTDGGLFDRRFRFDLQRDGEDQGGRAQERPLHRRRQRPRLQPADDRN